MNSSDTNPIEKTCSKCGIIKNVELFILNRNICKKCRNEKCREKYNQQNDNNVEKECNICLELKSNSLFIKNRNICKDCNNNKRVQNYKSNSEYREKIISQSSIFKKKKNNRKTKKSQY